MGRDIDEAWRAAAEEKEDVHIVGKFGIRPYTGTSFV